MKEATTKDHCDKKLFFGVQSLTCNQCVGSGKKLYIENTGHSSQKECGYFSYPKTESTCKH